jgi:hypothetical protein
LDKVLQANTLSITESFLEVTPVTHTAYVLLELVDFICLLRNSQRPVRA